MVVERFVGAQVIEQVVEDYRAIDWGVGEIGRRVIIVN